MASLKVYHCSYCQKAFENNSRLQRHLRCHTNERPFACDFCGRAFKESGHVSKHMVRCPQNTGKDDMAGAMTELQCYPCSKCSRAFMSEADLSMHCTLAHPAVFMTRCECGLRVSKDEIDEHRSQCAYLRTVRQAALAKWKRDQSRFHCGVCSRAFRSHTSLRHHEQWEHSGNSDSKRLPFQGDVTEFFPRRYQCKACERSFPTANMLQRHFKVVHINAQRSRYGLSPEEPSGSSPRPRPDGMDAAMDDPKKKGKRFDCRHCDLWFRTVEGLRFHSLQHASDSDVARSKTDKPNQTLSAVRKKIPHPPPSRKQPQDPLPSTSSSESAEDSSESASTSTESSEEEAEAGRSLDFDIRKAAGRDWLLQKQALHRLNQRYKGGMQYASREIFLCRYATCFLAFPSRRKLVRHEAVHESSRPYRCSACDTPSITRQQHDSHLSKCRARSLLGHSCDTCGMFFAERKTLNCHRDAEDHWPGSDACQFTCGHCREIFPSRRELNSHNKSSHQTIEPCKKQRAEATPSCSLSIRTRSQRKRSLRPSELTLSGLSADRRALSDNSGDQEDSSSRRKRRKKIQCSSKVNRSSEEEGPVETKEAEKQHVCHICGEAFPRRLELRRHMRESCRVGTLSDQTSSMDEASPSPDDSDIEAIVKVEDEVIAIPSSP